MNATSTPTLDMLPDMRVVAAAIAEDARENLDGVDVVSVGPLFAEPGPVAVQYSVPVIVQDRDKKNFCAFLRHA